ncbi:hypothetical protein L838_4735 [Mycobacterium avium MAV_120709_2344]|nr:hypothetical protein L838_4735 [Mycobacterium avium MAV_120709_2344]
MVAVPSEPADIGLLGDQRRARRGRAVGHLYPGHHQSSPTSVQRHYVSHTNKWVCRRLSPDRQSPVPTGNSLCAR